jgi:hypothetical protein
MLTHSEKAMAPVSLRLLPALALLLGSSVILAQSGPAAAALIRTEGMVYLNDKPVAVETAPFALTGDVARIRTDTGRAVVSLKRGGILALADHAAVSVHANGAYNFNRIDLSDGSAVLISGTSSPLLACGTDVRLSSGGVFRFNVLAPERVDGSARCDFRVYDGAGSTQGVTVTYVLRAGQRMTLNRRAGDMIPVGPVSAAEEDEFDQWSRRQFAASVR